MALDFESDDKVTSAITSALEENFSPEELGTQTEDNSTESSDYLAETTDAPVEPVDTAPKAEATAGENVEQKPKDEPKTTIEDEFSKAYGVPAKTNWGHENRVPHSRVKEIAKKAEERGAEAERKKYEGWAEPTRYKELNDKVQTYESQLQQVQRFEHVLEKEPDQFLEMLSKHPSYSPFFDTVRQLYTMVQGQGDQGQYQGDPMPLPTEDMGDGTKMYTTEGLSELMEWKAREVERRVASQFDNRYKQLEDSYKPIKDAWETEQRVAALQPKIKAQMDAAYQLKGFKENETAIVAAMASRPDLGLKDCYYMVMEPIWEKERNSVQANRNKIREEVLAEIKAAPSSTSLPARASKNVTAPSDKPKSTEDIIFESMRQAGLK